MTATIIQLADAVTNELTAGMETFSVAFLPVMRVIPAFDLEDQTSLSVIVVPGSCELSGETRSAIRHEMRIDIGIQKKVDDVEADTQTLLGFVEEISDYLSRRKLAGAPFAQWVKTENTTLYSPEHLFEQRLFVGVLSLTYRAVIT